jgi:hypothetical protein
MSRPVSEMAAALMEERGAIVSSGDCSSLEIAAAQACGRLFVDETGLGFVLRTKDWLVRAEQLIFDSREVSDE